MGVSGLRPPRTRRGTLMGIPTWPARPRLAMPLPPASRSVPLLTRALMLGSLRIRRPVLLLGCPAPRHCSRSQIFNKSSSGVKKYYDMGDLLGQGNFADVFKSTCKETRVFTKPDGSKGEIPQHVAIKSIDKSKVEDMNDITREIDIMKMVSHPNIIQLFEIFDESKKMHLVLELVTGGELFDRIVAKSSYTEREAANTIGTLCSALGHLHALKIVHRDLKPENILYASPAEDALIKVADFGLARLVSST